MGNARWTGVRLKSVRKFMEQRHEGALGELEASLEWQR